MTTKSGAPVEVITLHRNADRRVFFEAEVAEPIFFDPAIECWVVADPRQCETLLQSRGLRMSPYSSAYVELEKRSHRRFPNFQFAFRHIPLCQDGVDHRQARRRLADIIAAHRPALQKRIPEIVDRRFAPLVSGAEVDLIGDVFEPIVGEIIEITTDTKTAKIASAVKNASVVFDRMIGLRKRDQVEKDLGVIRTMIRESIGSHVSEQDEGDRLALFILGHDALLGTLGESVHQILRRHPDRKLSDIAYDATPVETGVPYAERIVSESVEVDGIHLAPGARVRLMLQSFQYSDAPSDKVRLFGIGVHSCLGKQMSLDVWEKTTAALARIEGVAQIVDYAMRTSDFVFTCPSKLVVRIS